MNIEELIYLLAETEYSFVEYRKVVERSFVVFKKRPSVDGQRYCKKTLASINQLLSTKGK